MDLNLSTEQQSLADNVRRFAERDYGFDQRRAILDSPAGFSEERWHAFVELGWLGAGLTEADGGFGGGAVENAVIAEEFGRALVVEPFLAAVLATQTLAACPAFAQRLPLIEAVVAGTERLSLAHLEAEGRGATAIVGSRATRDGEDWIIDGAKSLVLGAPMADRLLVSAVHGGGIGLFLVQPGAPGLALHPYRTVDNGRVADLRLDKVGATLLVDDALGAIETGIAHATVTACAEAVGAMHAALWMTRDYARTRKQFGQPIGSFQAYQHRMADMLVQCELARSMLLAGLAALEEKDAGLRDAGVSATKARIGEAGLFVGQQAIQLHGGIGMTEEYAIGHYCKRLFVLAQLFGSADFHIERFAALNASS